MARGHDEDLDEAARIAGLEMIDFLENNEGVSRSAAYSLISLAGDFQVSQVVNGVKGMRCLLRKDLFPPGADE
ncbi:MAG: hypothetical protein ABEJ81_01990 [Haloferacaceae archaeon]